MAGRPALLLTAPRPHHHERGAWPMGVGGGVGGGGVGGGERLGRRPCKCKAPPSASLQPLPALLLRCCVRRARTTAPRTSPRPWSSCSTGCLRPARARPSPSCCPLMARRGRTCRWAGTHPPVRRSSHWHAICVCACVSLSRGPRAGRRCGERQPRPLPLRQHGGLLQPGVWAGGSEWAWYALWWWVTACPPIPSPQTLGGSLHPTGPNDVARIAPQVAAAVRPLLQ